MPQTPLVRLMLQVTPGGSLPEAPSTGSTSPFTVIAVIAITIAFAQWQGYVDLLGWLPFGGGGGGTSGSSRSASSGGGSEDAGLFASIGAALTSPSALLLAGLGILGVLIVGGAVGGLGEGATVQLVILIELTSAAVLLNYLDALNTGTFAVVGGATVVIGLSAMGEPVFQTLVGSDVFPLLVLGAFYLLYREITDDDSRTQKLIVRAEGENGGDDEQ